VEISKIFPSILSYLSKKDLEKSKFFKEKGKTNNIHGNKQKDQSYVQATSTNIKEIIKIKYNFPNLSTKKIEEEQKNQKSR